VCRTIFVKFVSWNIHTLCRLWKFHRSWVWLHSDYTLCTQGTTVHNFSNMTMGRFSKAPENFRARKAMAKSRTSRLHSCFIHVFLIWREAPFIQEVSRVHASPFLHSDELKMALRARNVSRAFEGRFDGRRTCAIRVCILLPVPKTIQSAGIISTQMSHSYPVCISFRSHKKNS